MNFKPKIPVPVQCRVGTLHKKNWLNRGYGKQEWLIEININKEHFIEKNLLQKQCRQVGNTPAERVFA